MTHKPESTKPYMILNFDFIYRKPNHEFILCNRQICERNWIIKNESRGYWKHRTEEEKTGESAAEGRVDKATSSEIETCVPFSVDIGISVVTLRFHFPDSILLRFRFDSLNFPSCVRSSTIRFFRSERVWLCASEESWADSWANTCAMLIYTGPRYLMLFRQVIVFFFFRQIIL